MAIRDGGATVLVGWGSYMPNWLAHEHQEATMDQSKVMVGVEDDGGSLATCGRAVRWHSRVSDYGKVVEVQLWRIGRRGDEGKSSGAQELARGEVMESCPQPWSSTALSAWRWGKFQIGAWPCMVQGWVGSGSERT